MKTASLLVAAFLVCAGAAFAYDDHPYAKGDLEVRKQKFSDYRNEKLTTVIEFYYALGCKVFRNEGEFGAVVQFVDQELVREAVRLRVVYSFPVLSIDGSVREAAGFGLKKAKESGACAFWHNNPERVSDIRQLARDFLGSR